MAALFLFFILNINWPTGYPGDCSGVADRYRDVAGDGRQAGR